MKVLRFVFILGFIIPLYSGWTEMYFLPNEHDNVVLASQNEKDGTAQDRVLSAGERSVAKKRFLRDMSVIYDYVFQNYYKEPDPEKMLFGSLAGMMGNLGDAYSTFITPEEAKAYSEDIAGEFGGLGIRIDVGTDKLSGISYIKVITPIRNTPAERLGILPGDLITAVDETSLAGYTTREAVKIMRGKPGTKVELTIKRGEKTFSLEVVRAIINNINVEYDFIDDEIVYVVISSFTQDLPEDFAEVVEKIHKKKKDYKTIIVDLRNNPGGSLRSVVTIADAFLEAGLIVGTKGRDERKDTQYNATDALLIPKEKNVIVIVNEGSASASEILSGAIKDRGRGTVVGSTTFGKGLVQSVNAFESGFISITTSQYYTPSGTFINEKGVSPDREILPTHTVDAMSTTELRDLQTLIQENMALRFVEANDTVGNEAMFKAFKKKLEAQNLQIDDFFIKRSLHRARNRYNNTIEVFNLEFDSVLRSTVELIRKGML